ncbi:hypothetical protein BO78DRAFT_183370 [Aspergillus sclerotiicarbonarius CBS 121057]|uniref:Uncharacterized protein n=1 Tax=Aspergillus sclerotiicarbonarius (strain CBS 121057 / IBT 28362) TaxID=1448318 RepID=A0A319END4_ASPSB|nr:hypothetical protein BO78DRAFT_183370 [Aspergillus sclerotiicarbonarius CBS 121057]
MKYDGPQSQPPIRVASLLRQSDRFRGPDWRLGPCRWGGGFFLTVEFSLSLWGRILMIGFVLVGSSVKH